MLNKEQLKTALKVLDALDKMVSQHAECRHCDSCSEDQCFEIWSAAGDVFEEAIETHLSLGLKKALKDVDSTS